MAWYPIRICSPNKARPVGTTCHLRDMYADPMLQAFFTRFPRHLILSRAFGICTYQEQHLVYSDEAMLDDQGLHCQLVRDHENFAVRRPLIMGLVYWNHRPMTHDKWVRMLREAGFNVVEGRSLDDVARLLDERNGGEQ